MTDLKALLDGCAASMGEARRQRGVSDEAILEGLVKTLKEIEPELGKLDAEERRALRTQFINLLDEVTSLTAELEVERGKLIGELKTHQQLNRATKAYGANQP